MASANFGLFAALAASRLEGGGSAAAMVSGLVSPERGGQLARPNHLTDTDPMFVIQNETPS